MKIIRICVLKRPEPNTPSKYLYYVAWPLKFEIQRNETNMLRVTSGILAIIKQNKKLHSFVIAMTKQRMNTHILYNKRRRRTVHSNCAHKNPIEAGL